MLDKIKQIIINRLYIGKNYRKNIRGRPSKKLVEGWKQKHVAKNMLQVTLHDLDKLKQGKLNPEDKITINLIKSMRLKKFSFLDVGCGVGRYAELMDILLPKLDITYTGVDYSKPIIDAAKKHFMKGRRRFFVGNIQRLPFKNKEFDVICASRVIQYSPDYRKAVRELKRVAKKYVIVARVSITPGKDIWQKQGSYGSEYSHIIISENNLRNLFKKHKLKIVKEVKVKREEGDVSQKSYLLKVVS